MSATEIISFIAIILGLGGLIYLLHRSEAKTKNKYKLAAYNLLEQKKPDPAKIKKTIKYLRIYGGRFRRDKEFEQLQVLLIDILRETEKAGISSDKKIKK
jgi:hypothetical protein